MLELTTLWSLEQHKVTANLDQIIKSIATPKTLRFCYVMVSVLSIDCGCSCLIPGEK